MRTKGVYPKRLWARRCVSLLLTLLMALSMLWLSPASEKRVQASAQEKTIILAVERFTIGQGYYLEPQLVTIDEGERASQLLHRIIGDKTSYDGSPNRDNYYLQAITDGDTGEGLAVPAYIQDMEGFRLSNDGYAPGLGEFAYTEKSGWMYAIDSEFPGLSMGDHILQDGEVFRVQFTLWGLGTDLGAKAFDEGSVQPDFVVANRDALTRAVAEINSSPGKDEMLADPAVAAAYTKAYAILTDLAQPQWAVDTALADLQEAMGGESPDDYKYTELLLQDHELRLQAGETAALSISSLAPEIAGHTPSFSYTTSDASVASVDEAGNITALRPGTATLTCRVGRLSDSCIVTVTEREMTILSFAIGADTRQMTVGETDEIILRLTTDPPEAAQYAHFSFASSDEKIVSVDTDGLIRAKAAGTAEISVTVQGESRSCLVKVVAPPPTPGNDNDGKVSAAVRTSHQKTGGTLVNKIQTPVVDSTGGEWAVLGLARAGYQVPGDFYGKYLGSLRNELEDSGGLLSGGRKYTEYSRVILALTAIGQDPYNQFGYNLPSYLSDMENIKRQGNNGPMWAIIALDSGNYAIPQVAGVTQQTTRGRLVEEILTTQLADGSWSLDNTGDVDMTAMALTALAPYYTGEAGQPQAETDYAKIRAAVDSGLHWLSGQQRSSGGFGSWGTENLESSAQTLVALTALQINPDTDTRFVKNGRTVTAALLAYELSTGGFAHTLGEGYNQMATEQAYYALTAYIRYKEGKTSLYDMSDVGGTQIATVDVPRGEAGTGLTSADNKLGAGLAATKKPGGTTAKKDDAKAAAGWSFNGTSLTAAGVDEESGVTRLQQVASALGALGSGLLIVVIMAAALLNSQPAEAVPLMVRTTDKPIPGLRRRNLGKG